jgi:hypothetical protein
MLQLQWHLSLCTEALADSMESFVAEEGRIALHVHTSDLRNGHCKGGDGGMDGVITFGDSERFEPLRL